MNKHNAAQYLPFVQALADGKDLTVKIIPTSGFLPHREFQFTEPPENYRIVEPTKPMTTPTQRTPQQASIEAKEAREAWERGEAIEFDYGTQGWLPWNPQNALHPWFTSVEYKWRVAKPTPPIIGPGKWRMRNGEVIDVDVNHLPGWPWRSKNRGITWYSDGSRFGTNETNELDLLTRVETKWRAWHPEEVPLGREVRDKIDRTKRELIAVVNEGACTFLFNFRELLLPDGTYAPCGVEEVVG